MLGSRFMIQGCGLGVEPLGIMMRDWVFGTSGIQGVGFRVNICKY